MRRTISLVALAIHALAYCSIVVEAQTTLTGNYCLLDLKANATRTIIVPSSSGVSECVATFQQRGRQGTNLVTTDTPDLYVETPNNAVFTKGLRLQDPFAPALTSSTLQIIANQGSGDITHAFWIWVPQLRAQIIQSASSISSPTGVNFQYGINAQGKFCASCDFVLNGVGINNLPLCTNDIVPVGVWTHLAVSVPALQTQLMNIFVNGQLAASASPAVGAPRYTSAQNNNGGAFQLGALAGDDEFAATVVIRRFVYARYNVPQNEIQALIAADLLVDTKLASPTPLQGMPLLDYDITETGFQDYGSQQLVFEGQPQKRFEPSGQPFNASFALPQSYLRSVSGTTNASYTKSVWARWRQSTTVAASNPISLISNVGGFQQTQYIETPLYAFNQHTWQLMPNGSACAWHDGNGGFDADPTNGARVCTGSITRYFNTAWVHLAVTYNSLTRTLTTFVNGLRENALQDPCTPASGRQDVNGLRCFGGSTLGYGVVVNPLTQSSDAFPGELRQVQVLSKAVTHAELQQLIQNQRKLVVHRFIQPPVGEQRFKTDLVSAANTSTVVRVTPSYSPFSTGSSVIRRTENIPLTSPSRITTTATNLVLVNRTASLAVYTYLPFWSLQQAQSLSYILLQLNSSLITVQLRIDDGRWCCKIDSFSVCLSALNPFLPQQWQYLRCFIDSRQIIQLQVDQSFVQQTANYASPNQTLAFVTSPVLVQGLNGVSGLSPWLLRDAEVVFHQNLNSTQPASNSAVARTPFPRSRLAMPLISSNAKVSVRTDVSADEQYIRVDRGVVNPTLSFVASPPQLPFGTADTSLTFPTNQLDAYILPAALAQNFTVSFWIFRPNQAYAAPLLSIVASSTQARPNNTDGAPNLLFSSHLLINGSFCAGLLPSGVVCTRKLQSNEWTMLSVTLVQNGQTCVYVNADIDNCAASPAETRTSRRAFYEALGGSAGRTRFAAQPFDGLMRFLTILDSAAAPDDIASLSRFQQLPEASSSDSEYISSTMSLSSSSTGSSRSSSSSTGRSSSTGAAGGPSSATRGFIPAQPTPSSTGLSSVSLGGTGGGTVTGGGTGGNSATGSSASLSGATSSFMASASSNVLSLSTSTGASGNSQTLSSSQLSNTLDNEVLTSSSLSGLSGSSSDAQTTSLSSGSNDQQDLSSSTADSNQDLNLDQSASNNDTLVVIIASVSAGVAVVLLLSFTAAFTYAYRMRHLTDLKRRAA